MEVNIFHVPFSVTTWDVKRAIGVVLHSDAFADPSQPERRDL